MLQLLISDFLIFLGSTSIQMDINVHEELVIGKRVTEESGESELRHLAFLHQEESFLVVLRESLSIVNDPSLQFLRSTCHCCQV